jgi:hypothetical protein
VTFHSGYGGRFEGVEGESGTIVTETSPGDTSNFFCLRDPYFYLQCWVDRNSLPPRQTAFPQEPDMSFEGEFFEIVNSRPEGHRMSELLKASPGLTF